MRNHRIYGVLAREELEVNAVAPGEETPAAPVEAGADSLEADLVEVNADIVDLQADEAATDEAAEVVDEMEVAVESLRIIAGNGGLDRNGAMLLNQMNASWNRRLGLPENHKTVSTESFGGANSRAGQTSLAAESIADKAKEVWGKIVEMFRNALKAIVAVWNRIFDGATRMKARAENLGKAAGATKGEATAKTFENQKLAENLHINGNIDAKAAAAAVNQEASVLQAISKHAIAFAGQATSAVESGDTAKLPELAKGAHDIVKSGFSKVADAASVGVAAPGEGMELFKGEALPGNKAIVAIVPADGAKADAIGKTSFKLGIFDASKKVAEKAELAVLSTADIADIAKKIGAAAEMLISYKSVQKEAEGAANKVIALAEKKAKEQAEGEGENKMSGADARAIAKGAMAMVTNVAPPLAAFALNAGGYVLQYGEQSLKQYGKAKEEKKPAEAAAPAAA